ncbi:MAG: TIGR04282 family arsenosugar biosynthesis glycosyltransferase [Pseudomonadota bacterium]
MQRSLILMVKRPVAGAVKTRLAKTIWTAEALRFYRTSLADTMRRLGRDPRWRLVLAVAPETAVNDATWPRHLSRMAQCRGGLGEKMQGAIDAVPTGPALIIGSDIPGITGAEIWSAFQALGRTDVVIGPSPDGGYWLIGSRRLPRSMRLFPKPVRWSTEYTLEDTVAGLAGATVSFINERADVDTEAEWRAWRRGDYSAN